MPHRSAKGPEISPGVAVADAFVNAPPPHPGGEEGWGGGGGGGDSLRASFKSHASTGTQSTAGLGSSIPLQHGEMFDDEFERPTSAPPPPGFGAGPEERNRMANELLWGGGAVQNPNGMGYNHHGAYTQQYVSSVANSHGHAAMPDDRQGSFSNLAAILGPGLVQSIEDATLERDADLSYHRMTRHAASRLVGTTPPKHSDALHLHATPHPKEVPPKSLRSAGAAAYGTRDPHQEEYIPDSKPAPGDARGFPSSLSTPNRNTGGEYSGEEEHGNRATTPVQMYPGQTSRGHRPLPVMGIGMKVTEPEGEQQFTKPGVVSHRLDHLQGSFTNALGNDGRGSIAELERGMQNMWSPEAKEFKPASPHRGGGGGDAAGPPSGSSSISDSAGGATELSSHQAVLELKPFLWDIDQSRPSRTLAVLHASWLRVPDVRSACETFGVLESFRSDFSSRGIFFVSYYDIRSAQYASVELQSILQRMSVMQRSSDEVLVRYCLSLHSSSQFDESQIMVSDLPSEVDENALRAMLSSYGAIRNVIHQGEGSYLIEFQNLQDSKQALLELDSSQPWGPSVNVEVGLRNPVERKRGRELLAMIGRWRLSIGRQSHGNADMRHFTAGGQQGPSGHWRPEQSRPYEVPQTQFVLGPDNRYTQVAVQQAPGFSQSQYAHQGATAFDARHQQIIQGPDGQIYITAPVPQQVQQSSHVYVPQQGAFNHGAPATIVTKVAQSTPYYAHVVASDASSLGGVSGRSHRSAHSSHLDDKDTRHLMLDLDAVETGLDTRTSLMVRNIPNKYSQQMLLSEFDENGHGPGVIDFFYLPIDFKNRCNRGYAFINFVDYKDILAFHRQYFGKHWRTFNSDKICDITYARIQGKAAMLKRFENSALMEKDDEYKPLVFVSDGPEKGKRLPFPDPANKNRAEL